MIARGPLAALVMLLLAAPLAAAQDVAPVEAAQKEGQLVWYTGLIVNQIVRPLVNAFEAKYPGIRVAYSRATSSDNALKIINEARAGRPQADIFDGSAAFVPLREAKLVASFHPANAASYPPEMKDPDGLWTAMNVYYFAPAYNTKLVAPGDAPRTYADLLDPKWKGRIAWTYDLSPGGPPGFIHNILTIMGPEKGMDYMRRFAAQEPVTIPAAQRVVLDKVIAGEYPLAVMTLHNHSVISAALGAPVDWIKMQPVVEVPNLLSVVQGAPHPTAAKLFIEFVLSKDGQQVLAANDYMPADPTVPVKVPDLQPEAGHFTATVITPDEMRDGLPKWIELYHQLFR
ncbi:MAG: ABC transporter substrate-binding protein [Nevskiales bacterium]